MPNQLKDYFFFNLKSKPYALLGFTGFILAIISLAPVELEALDIPWHDIYFVIPNMSILGIVATVLLFLWSIYIAANRLMLSIKLTWVHVIATILTVIVLLIPIDPTWGMSGVPRRYYAMTDFPAHKPFFNSGLIYTAMLLILLIAQLVFLINLIMGIFQSLRSINPKK